MLDIAKVPCYFFNKQRGWPSELGEVIKMLEFVATMAVIALVFVAATVLVALVAGGLVKIRQAATRKELERAKTN